MSERFLAIVLALTAMLFAFPTSAQAQQVKKVPRIGYLSLRSDAGDIDLAFRQGLRDLGYIEGQNVIIEWRFAEGKSERYPLLAAELVHIGVDAIVTNSGDDPIVAAMKSTKTIPIIFETGSDPVARGFVASLPHPERNQRRQGHPQSSGVIRGSRVAGRGFLVVIPARCAAGSHHPRITTRDPRIELMNERHVL